MSFTAVPTDAVFPGALSVSRRHASLTLYSDLLEREPLRDDKKINFKKKRKEGYYDKGYLAELGLFSWFFCWNQEDKK